MIKDSKNTSFIIDVLALESIAILNHDSLIYFLMNLLGWPWFPKSYRFQLYMPAHVTFQKIDLF